MLYIVIYLFGKVFANKLKSVFAVCVMKELIFCYIYINRAI